MNREYMRQLLWDFAMAVRGQNSPPVPCPDRRPESGVRPLNDTRFKQELWDAANEIVNELEQMEWLR